MILNFLKEISLETLRKNIEINLENYKATTNDWIFKFFDDSSPFLEFKKDVPQFNLDTSSERPEQTDLENVRILYSSMKHLSVVEAANENLWAGMAHSDFWDYVKYRNSFDKKEATENLIKNTFFFSHGKRKSLIMHPLARLWWTGHLVYDGTRADPFELLNVFKTDFRTKLLYLFSSNFSNSPTVTKAFLSAIHDFEKNGVNIKTKLFNEIIIYLNILGGTYLLDYFEESELKEKITEKIDSLLLIMD
jgi:hypothetical protein